MERVTRKDLAATAARKSGLSEADCNRVLSELLAELVGHAYHERIVDIRYFGRFQVKTRAGRPARNLRTGEAVWVPPTRKLVFRFSKAARDYINSRPIRATPNHMTLDHRPEKTEGGVR